MSDYTTQLRFICEAYAGRETSAPSADVDNIIELARQKIFDFNYPIFDENYRRELETKILNHFYTQEIGLETVGLWKLKLRTKMREIMPYYNQLYKSELLKFDPFINTDYTDERQTVGTEQNQTTGTTHSTNTADSLQTTTGIDNHIHEGEAHGDSFDSVSKTAQGQTAKQTQTDEALVELNQNKHTGADTTTYEPIADKKTLVKHSDTPLGSVDGVTATGDNSNYLSDVTQTVENYNGSNKHDETTNNYNSKVVDDKTATNNVTGAESGTTAEQATEAGANSHNDTDTATDDSTRIETTTGTNTGTADGATTSESLGSNATDYAGRIFGKTGSETYSEMLQKFRDTFLNIDMDVINELNPLFMLLW